MLIRSIRIVLVSCALLGVATGPSPAQEKPAKKKNGIPPSGAKLYKQHCAVCHGDDGKGAGPPPSNSPFKEPPPDLTTLARRHGGRFPDAFVASVLRSGAPVADHGPAEMPVWGTLFQSMTKSDEAKVRQRIASLTSYLKSLQAP